MKEYIICIKITDKHRRYWGTIGMGKRSGKLVGGKISNKEHIDDI